MPFEEVRNYPCAVVDGSGEPGSAIPLAYRWAVEKASPGESILVWASRKDSVRQNALARSLVAQPNIVLVTPRDARATWDGGPVIALWADAGDLAKLPRHITALVVVGWNPRGIEPWVRAVRPERLGKCAPWQGIAPGREIDLDPGVDEAFSRISGLLNLSGTITAGYNKSYVVQALLALHDAGHVLRPRTVEAWAIAAGWGSGNAAELAKMCGRVNAGTRLRWNRSDRLPGFAVQPPLVRGSHDAANGIRRWLRGEFGRRHPRCIELDLAAGDISRRLRGL